MICIKTNLTNINSNNQIFLLKNLSLTSLKILQRMFFVGSTGQILTLILTVCLPFVFLVSSEPKAELLKDTLLFENIQIQHETFSFEYNSFQIQLAPSENDDDTKTWLEDTFIQKIPITKDLIKWKSFCAESSGNKAPPTFNRGYC